MKSTLLKPKIFLCSIGISGSGKSTYLYSKFSSDVIVEPDAIRKEITGSTSDQSRDREVFEEVLKRVLKNLEDKKLSVLDATNTFSSSRTKFLKQLPEGTHKVAIVFQPEGNDDEEIVDKLYNRIQKDLKDGKDRSAVPKDVIVRQLQQFKNGQGNIKGQFDEVQIINV